MKELDILQKIYEVEEQEKELEAKEQLIRGLIIKSLFDNEEIRKKIVENDLSVEYIATSIEENCKSIEKVNYQEIMNITVDEIIRVEKRFRKMVEV